MTSDSPVGLLAGSGKLPVMAAERLTRAGQSVVVGVLESDHTDKLNEFADVVQPLDLTELGTIPDFFLDHGVVDLYLLGDVDKQQIFEQSQRDAADSTVQDILSNTSYAGDEQLIKAGARYLEWKGLSVCGIDEIMEDLITPNGLLGGPDHYEKNEETIAEIASIARVVSEHEVGQSVIGKNRTVVAVEAVEGTDRLIQRAEDLAGPHAVMAKMARTNQDFRFDVPVIGEQTVRQLAEINADMLAIESGKTLWLQRENCRSIAKQADLCLYGIELSKPSFVSRLFSWFSG